MEAEYTSTLNSNALMLGNHAAADLLNNAMLIYGNAERYLVTLAGLKQLHARYYGVLNAYACSVTSSQTEIDELIGNLFSHLWQNRKRHFKGFDPEVYLFKSLRMILIKNARQKRLTDLYQVPFNQLDIRFSTHLNLEGADCSMLNNLDNRAREIIFLHCAAQVSLDKIGSIVGCRSHKVYDYYQDALCRLIIN